jgi:hypothetical protein
MDVSQGRELHSFKLRLMSHEPVELDDTEHFNVFDSGEVLERARKQIRATSYMAPVHGPNREVMWSIEWYNTNRGRWETMAQGKSRLKRGMLPS